MPIRIPIILLYLVFVLLTGFYVKKRYKTEKFWELYDFLRPDVCFVLLFVFLAVYFKYPVSGPLIFLLAFFALIVALPVFVASFVMLLWLTFLKKKEYGPQTVWIYHKTEGYLKIYLPLAIIAFLFTPLSSHYVPEISGAFVAASFYFGALFFATALTLTNKEDMRWFCEAGLNSINDESNRSLKKKLGEKSAINNCLLPFPTVLKVFNDFLKRSEYPGPPHISRKCRYNCYKALLMSFAKGDGHLDDSSREGIGLMIEAVKNPVGLRFFHTFIEGLNYISPGMTNIETFEAPFGFIAWLERNLTIVSIIVLILTAAAPLLIKFLFGV